MRVFINDTKTEKRISLFNPRKDLWKNHFKWSDDFLQIIGKTPIGKITIDALQLNRIGVVNIRRLMILGNLHPPFDTI